jgi:D-3-phosphoglycerate dehydrogenase
MLAVARRPVAAGEYARKGRWSEFCQQSPGVELSGKTLGIIGLGAIGSALARKLNGFDMNLLVFDPYVDDARVAKFGGRSVTLEQLLVESDIVTIHAPLANETRLLIGKRELAIMKRSAILINTARGRSS